MDLDIDQDERFQRREWRFERLGWALVTLFVLAGLVGFLGNGWFSWATARSDSGVVQVEYQRVTHHEADDTVTMTFAPEGAVDGELAVQLTGSWVSGVDIQGITPQPSEESAVPGGVLLTFAVDQPGEIDVSIGFRAQDYSNLSATAAVGEETATFDQLVLP